MRLKRLWLETLPEDRWSALVIAGHVVAILLILGCMAATAHEAPTGWSYPYSCCSSIDCRQAADGSVRELADGYHVPSGEVISYRDKRVKESPDGLFHICAHQSGIDAGKVICLFVPPRAF